eukprot:3517342-Alexandrium_andersonii.AAC.1
MPESPAVVKPVGSWGTPSPAEGDATCSAAGCQRPWCSFARPPRSTGLRRPFLTEIGGSSISHWACNGHGHAVASPVTA